MSIYRGRTNTEVYLASVLYDAIDDQDYSAIATLLTVKSSDPNIILPRRGISPFHLAVGSDPPQFALKVTSIILQHGGDPNIQSDEGLTPLHIAAAWNRTEILQLLLNCGGNPEITDNCYKNALHYSEREGHLEATKIIRGFIELQRASALDDYWEDKAQCKLTLDKIVVNNAGLIGEYEGAKVEDTNVNVAEDLNKLPQTNSNEYVLNWCNSQVTSRTVYTDESSLGSSQSSAESYSPVHENTTLSCSQKSFIASVNTKCKERVGLIRENICYHRETSRESGIATLPGSLTDDKIINDYRGYVLLTTDSDVSVEDACDHEIKKTGSGKTKDTSSDYYTCTEVSEDANVLEQNIYEISSSSSSGKSSCSSETTSKVNCVSISEIYKYTDAKEGVVLFEKRSLVPSAINNQNDSGGTNITKSSKLSSLPRSFDYDTDSLRKELTRLGYDPGPITKSTKRVYLRKLYHLKKQPGIIRPPPKENDICKKVYSSELEKTLREPNWADDLTVLCKLEEDVTKEFLNPHSTRRWREGLNKSSFTYLLLDPRITKNLPCRAENLTQDELWKTFLSSIFYVGKGKRARPYSHLYDAITYFKKKEEECKVESDKIKHILEIWRDNQGVICLHVFQNVIPVEAYTREAAMISALKTENITNLKAGDFYGVAATWTKHQRNLLGVYLLYKAMKIFLNEGERQLSPYDID